ncbi:MAG TPA: UvrD-helicase domain-containing protein [Kofleriaceae bacterium]|nr:UvrD-helicase domain-containing protein [Kofleriaceae bacterium]
MSGPPIELADAAARERIRRDLDTTFVVEAAAGTGKTTALVGRILSLIQSGRGELQRIAAVTFTDKAAGEMKLRLRAEIDRERGAAATAAEQERFDRALAQLELARIGTIHWFCADILRERPVEAAIDPGFSILDEEEAATLLERVFDRWFEDRLDDPPEGIRRFLRRQRWSRESGPREVLLSACRDLVEHRDHPAPWRRDPFDRAAAIADVLRDLTALAGLAARAYRDADPLRRALARLVDTVARIEAREADGGRDLDLVEAELVALPREVDWNWRGSGRFYGDGVLRADVVLQRDQARAGLDRFLALAQADLAACLHRELAPVVAAYEEEKSKLGRLDFLDLLVRARDLVRDDAGVRRALQDRFTHILVDEFQDTDPLQAEILMLLAADDPSVRDASSARPAPGKLFVVGDPKQSIYRFRRAEVALYERIKQRVVQHGGELLYLTTSFRGVPEIQRAVNRAFAPLMTGGDDGSQAEYVALEPARPARPGRPSVIALPVPRPYSPYGRVTKRAVAESTPDAVAGFVQWLLTASGWTVEDPTTRAEVALASHHICLLFRQFVSFGADLTRPYLRALEARRIPHVLIGGRSFHDREEVMAVRSALRAIEWPDDELHVYATLRGPYLALHDEQLFRFREEVGKLHPLRPIPPEGADELAEVADALTLLRDLHMGRNRRPIADTIAGFLDATRAHAGIAIWPTGEQALANVLRVLEEARRFEARGATSFRSFVDWLEDRAERGEGAQAPVVEEGSEGVRMMTVHRAKGLEFPVVILCDPGCSREKTRPSRHVDPARALWAAPLAGCTPIELAEHQVEVLRADNAEEVRVAYVAATRARDLLVVPCCGDDPVAGWVDVLHPALYPDPARRRQARPAPGCPPFGPDSVLHRPSSAPADPDRAVAPGHHTVGDADVVWWDPALLPLDPPPIGGVRQQDLLVADQQQGDDRRSLDDYHRWKQARSDALSRGAIPTFAVTTATRQAATERPIAGDVEVKVIETEAAHADRPGGRRFGTLVHAVLADVPLEAAEHQIEPLVALHARLLGATPDESTAAIDTIRSTLAHDLLARAAAAARRGHCHRELPLTTCDPTGAFIDGVADLAFTEPSAEGDRWIVVDYKTEARRGSHAAHAAQVRLYARALARATGQPATGVVLVV